MYTTVNFKTKKALREAIARGDEIGVYEPGISLAEHSRYTGIAYIEGPHAPAPHTWYATAEVYLGRITSIE